MILYLNRRWDVADGGALRIFPAYEYSYGLPASPEDAPHLEDVAPEGGTLVLVMSGDVEHEVMETRKERQCVVGWFREASVAPAPDLATASTRTLRLLDRRTTDDSCAALTRDLG